MPRPVQPVLPPVAAQPSADRAGAKDAGVFEAGNIHLLHVNGQRKPQFTWWRAGRLVCCEGQADAAGLQSGDLHAALEQRGGGPFDMDVLGEQLEVGGFDAQRRKAQRSKQTAARLIDEHIAMAQASEQTGTSLQPALAAR